MIPNVLPKGNHQDLKMLSNGRIYKKIADFCGLTYPQPPEKLNEMTSVLSLTFHCPEHLLNQWKKYVDEQLSLLADNLMDVDQYYLSEVQSEMVNEGKNYNLLLIFSNADLRDDFLESELKNIEERIFSEFGSDVMLFETLLNPLKIRV